MNILKYLTPLFITPLLAFSQSALAQNKKPSLNQRLAMQAKPAVVRIISRCEGNFYYYSGGVPEDANKKKIELKSIDFIEHPSTEDFPFNLNFVGTGFFVNSRGYIVTSSRVAISKEDCEQGIKRNLRYKLKEERILTNFNDNDEFNRIIKDKGYLEIIFGGDRDNVEVEEGEWNVYLPYSQSRPLFNGNIKQFEIIKSGREYGEPLKLNRDIAILKVHFNHSSPALKFGDSSEVNIQDKVLIVGYPNAADVDLGEDVKLAGKSYFTPSVQEGRISNPNKELEGDYPILQADINAARGNAGSPLINEKGEMVGMLAFNDSDKDSDDNNNGEVIPIAVPVSTIQEFIEQSNIANTQSDIDKFYLRGLQNLWKGNLQEAKANFINVKVLFPIHSEVERLINEIDQIEAYRLARPWTNPTYIFAFVLIIGSGIVGTIVYFLLKQRPIPKSVPAEPDRRSTNRSSVYTSSTSPHRSNGKGKKCFVEMEYKGQIQRFQLDKSERRLGRDPNWSDFDIPSTWEVISRRHAIFKKEGDDYRLYDGDGSNPSRNGVWVSDDFRVDPREGHLLNNGDRLIIGQDAHEQVLVTYFNPNSEQTPPSTTMAN